MKLLFATLLSLSLAPSLCLGQVGGNISYAQNVGRNRLGQPERTKRTLSLDELPPTSTSMFLEANVLMNVKAEEYVAVFAISQEGSTVAECGRKMDAVIQTFSDALKALGIKSSDLFVDFIAQNKIYGFDVTDGIAKEKLVGIELKKNLFIHFHDYALLDKLVLAAGQSQVYDLIKVDYVVKDVPALRAKLMDTAAKVIKDKAVRYERLFGIRLQASPQLYAEKPDIYFPSQMYDSYVAAESEDVSVDYYRQKYLVQSARKSRTFFFHPLDAGTFDTVINPVVTEPVIQATLYLKMKYLIQAPVTKEAPVASKGKITSKVPQKKK